MSFLYPVFLIGALAAAIPIALHLLRRDVAPEVPFTAVRLLRRSPMAQTRRRRIRDLLLLAARVAALLLLAAAFARPYLTAAAGESALRIVAIDRSFSMNAPGRVERAVAEARREIDAAGRGDRIAVIAFDDRAEVVAPAGPPADARAAIEAVRPGYGGTRFGPLFAQAIALAGSGPARLVIVTDLQRSGWEGEAPVGIPDALQFEVRDAGAHGANAAVVSLRAATDAVTAGISNAGASAVSGTARVTLDGGAVASAPFSVGPAASAEVVIPHRVPLRGVLTVAIDDPSGFLADNRRFLLLDGVGRTGVLIIGSEEHQSGFYLARALQSADEQAGYEVRTMPPASLAALSAQELGRQSVIVLLTTRNLERRAREMVAGFVRRGGGLLIAAAADVDADVLATMMGWPGFSAVEQPVGSTVLAATDLRHPIFRPFGPLAANLGQVRFTRTWQVRADGWDVAARFAGGAPAVLEHREGSGRVLLLAFDVDQKWNDFPLNPAFVPFAIEAVRHVTAFTDTRRDYLVADAPRGVPSEPGVYTLAGGRRVTINVDPRESATTRLTVEEFSARIERLPGQPAAPAGRGAAQTEARQSLWRYGVLLMLAALVAESVAGRTT